MSPSNTLLEQLLYLISKALGASNVQQLFRLSHWELRNSQWSLRKEKNTFQTTTTTNTGIEECALHELALPVMQGIAIDNTANINLAHNENAIRG